MRHLRLSSALPWLLAIIATAIALTLAVRHRKLVTDVIEHRRSDLRVRRGDYLPDFVGTSTAGTEIGVGSTADTSRRQIVFYLTSACPFCKQTLPAWSQIAARLESSSSQFQVVALTTDSMSVATRFGDSLSLSYPLVPFASAKLARLSKGGTVPQTLVLDSDGRVLFARSGVISSQLSIDSVIAAARSPHPLRGRLLPVSGSSP